MANIERQAADYLIAVIQELSLVRSLDEVMTIVRRAARELTGAEGATFVLREGDCCYYAEENAISPLWKGQRFPMSACISGWVMQHAQPVVIEDIYQDPRVPADAYRPTFVKSLAMVPIRTRSPVGAIGNYWAQSHLASEEEVHLLQALANSTSIAMENVRVYEELEQRVRDRTAQLEAANQELEAFSYSVSHDLRAPLRAIDGFSAVLLERAGDVVDERGRDALDRIRRATGRMSQLIEDLLELSRISRTPLERREVDLSAMASDIVAELKSAAPERNVRAELAPELTAQGDPRLLRIALENLLNNAWKYTGHSANARIEFGASTGGEGAREFFVRDNGAGFDMARAERLFAPFQRLHSKEEFPGSGVGLATVQRIIHRHGGHIRAHATPGSGATFSFTLP